MNATGPRRAPPSRTNARYALYSPLAIVLSTFLLTPLVGGTLAALNFSRLDREAASRLSMIAGVVGTAVLYFVITFGDAFLGVLSFFSAALVAGALSAWWVHAQLAAWRVHRLEGGAEASMVIPIASGLAILVVLFLTTIAPAIRARRLRREVAQAQDAFNRGKCDEAMPHLRAASQLAPTHPAVRYEIAVCEYYAGNRAKGTQLLKALGLTVAPAMRNTRPVPQVDTTDPRVGRPPRPSVFPRAPSRPGVPAPFTPTTPATRTQ